MLQHVRHHLNDLPPGLTAGRISRVDRTGYEVLTPDATLRVAALPPPADERDTPTVGDWLALDGAVAVHRLARSSLLARGSAAKHSGVQPLAANVDVVLVCAGLHTDLPVRRIERLLTLAWDSGALPVLVLTKADLCADPASAQLQARRHAPGVEIAVVSAATGDTAALQPSLREGSTLVLLGASGAGKSTLVNALAGEELMPVGESRQVDGKGRHTTSHRELFALPCGAVVIDTPGLRGVALQGGEQALAQAFSDVEELAVACRFADCAHVGEPGCAVQASIDAGDLALERVDSWRQLQRELAFQARRKDARLRSEERQRWKHVTKQQRARGARP
ncbi:MAG TPA: ribosome small subunit-dependent GTPase A [Mycobacteriales bacterium]|jgi:ribosome biogenesis GTPase|nr:ribosome small subunit-dependent GTPase A [Mycobacteriales bacterium]